MSRIPAYKRLGPTNHEPVTCPAWMVESGRKTRILLEAISDEFLVSPKEILGKSKSPSAALARHVAYWVLRTTTRLGYGQIANRFDRKDHCSIIHGFDRVESLRKTDSNFRAITNTILAVTVEGRPPVMVPAPSPHQLDRKPAGKQPLSVGGMLF